MIGQVYNQRKQTGFKTRNPQCEDIDGRECQAVAIELGVGRATVERGGAYATAIDRLTSLLGVEPQQPAKSLPQKR